MFVLNSIRFFECFVLCHVAVDFQHFTQIKLNGVQTAERDWTIGYYITSPPLERVFFIEYRFIFLNMGRLFIFSFFCAHGTLNVAALWHSVVVKGGKLTQRRRHLIRIESANVLTLYPYQHKDQLGEWSIRKGTLSFNLQFFCIFFCHNFEKLFTEGWSNFG